MGDYKMYEIYKTITAATDYIVEKVLGIINNENIKNKQNRIETAEYFLAISDALLTVIDKFENVRYPYIEYFQLKEMQEAFPEVLNKIYKKKKYNKLKLELIGCMGKIIEAIGIGDYGIGVLRSDRQTIKDVLFELQCSAGKFKGLAINIKTIKL